MINYFSQTVDFQDGMCCLSKPDDRSELEKIRNKWMTPKELIKVFHIFCQEKQHFLQINEAKNYLDLFFFPKTVTVQQHLPIQSSHRCALYGFEPHRGRC